MDIELNETQRMLVDAARELLEDQMQPGRRAAAERSAEGYDVDLWRSMGSELGWVGVGVGEAYGGAGSSLLDAALLYEQLCRAAALTPFAETVAGARVIERHASEEIRRALLPDIATGKLIVTSALLEDSDDFTAAPATVVTGSAGALKITGRKRFVSYGDSADVLLTTARLPGGGSGIAIVRRSPQISAVRVKTIGGGPVCNVTFDGAAVLGVIDASTVLTDLLQVNRALNCTASIGYGGRAFEMTVDYTKERVQFGRPIGMFEAVQQIVANMAIAMEGARWLAYQAAWCIDDPGTSPEQREIEVRMASAHTGWAARETTLSSHQLHGGVGFMLEYDLHYYTRRAKEAEIFWGTPEEHYTAIGRATVASGRGHAA